MWRMSSGLYGYNINKKQKMFAPLSFLHWTVRSFDWDEIWYRDRLDHGEENRSR